jgi:hypothetical protein
MREIDPSEYEFYVLNVTKNVFSGYSEVVFAGSYSECRRWQVENQHITNPPVIGFLKEEPCKWTHEAAHKFIKENYKKYLESIGDESGSELILEDGGWKLKQETAFTIT